MQQIVHTTPIISAAAAARRSGRNYNSTHNTQLSTHLHDIFPHFQCHNNVSTRNACNTAKTADNPQIFAPSYANTHSAGFVTQM